MNTPATVHVGCKLPNGLILELGKPGSDNYKRVILNGANAALVKTAGGFGITEVETEFWQAWRKKHSWLPALKEGHVFAVDDLASAQAAAVEREGVRTGLEPLDPNKAPSGIEVDGAHLKSARQSAVAAQSGRGA